VRASGAPASRARRMAMGDSGPLGAGHVIQWHAHDIVSVHVVASGLRTGLIGTYTLSLGSYQHQSIDRADDISLSLIIVTVLMATGLPN